MNYFYFFKVTLIYFDDERKTFFITPDQSETDDRGVPFSENELLDTAEFKEFVKKTKADIIDIDYIEYAVEYDPKKSDILSKPVTPESFAELEKSGQLNIIDENQLLLCLKRKKPSKGSSKLHIICLVSAAAFVGGMLLAGAKKPAADIHAPVESNVSSESSDEPETSDESSGDLSNTVSDSTETSDDSDDSSSDTSSDSLVTSSESGDSSSEPTSDNSETSTDSSETSSESSDSSDSSSALSSDNSETSSNSGSSSTESEVNTVSTTDIFNIESQSDMAVTLYYDVEEPAVPFISPDGNVVPSSDLSAQRREGAVVFYIPNAAAGQWQMNYDKKSNAVLDVNWAPYGAPAQMGGV